MTDTQEQILAWPACGSGEQIIAMIRGRREDTRHLPEFERAENRKLFAQERACRLAELDRSTFQYEGDDAAMRERMRALAATRCRSGKPASSTVPEGVMEPQIVGYLPVFKCGTLGQIRLWRAEKSGAAYPVRSGLVDGNRVARSGRSAKAGRGDPIQSRPGSK